MENAKKIDLRLSHNPNAAKKKETRLYNVLFPVWMLIFVPTVWFYILPGNFIIDSAVLIGSLWILARKRGDTEYRPWRDWIRSIWLVWIFGFLSDLIGAGFLLFWGFAPGLLFSVTKNSDLAFASISDSDAYDAAYVSSFWEDKISVPIMSNPFESLLAVLFVLITIAFCGWLIYSLNSKISLRRLDLSDWERKRAALMLALLTSPYMMLLPSKWFW